MKYQKTSSKFKRIIKRKHNPRSLLWTTSMLMAVIGLIIYLNLKSRGM